MLIGLQSIAPLLHAHAHEDNFAVEGLHIHGWQQSVALEHAFQSLLIEHHHDAIIDMGQAISRINKLILDDVGDSVVPHNDILKIQTSGLYYYWVGFSPPFYSNKQNTLLDTIAPRAPPAFPV